MTKLKVDLSDVRIGKSKNCYYEPVAKKNITILHINADSSPGFSEMRFFTREALAYHRFIGSPEFKEFQALNNIAMVYSNNRRIELYSSELEPDALILLLAKTFDSPVLDAAAKSMDHASSSPQLLYEF